MDPTPVTPRDAAPLILLVDDEPLLLQALRRILEGDGHRVALAQTPEDVEPLLPNPALGVVLLDLILQGTTGLALLECIKQQRPEVEVVMMTGHGSVESAVRCMRRGAFDYLEKPFDDVYRVRTTVRKAIERRTLVLRNRQLEEELRGRSGAPDLIGSSAAMRGLKRKIGSLRHNESHVLIRGESGTGKELAAQAIHAASPRSAGPFVPIDCGALPETIIESELFGHERGAFTGAVGAPGLFRRADGGTLFLDEIGEIASGVQAKLLRALQYKEVRPVGGTEAIPIDIRVISATHRDLESMVAEGQFRMDLFYRLNVVRIEIPPLRDRREDIPMLVHHFLAQYRRNGSPVEGIEDDAMEVLTRHEWPGNVRELENAIESALALSPAPRLRVADLPIPRRAAVAGYRPPEAELLLSLEAYERCALERALRETGCNAPEAARRLGIGRSTFYRKLAKFGIRARRAGLGGGASIG